MTPSSVTFSLTTIVPIAVLPRLVVVATGTDMGRPRKGAPLLRAGRCLIRCDRRLDLPGAGRRWQRLPGADRAVPPRAAGALLPDARIVPGRRGRSARNADGRL